MKKKLLPVFMLLAVTSLMVFAKKSDPKQEMNQTLSPATSLKMLQEGNARYVSGKSLYPNQERERREETFAKQTPFAIVVGCSDSRVPPEIIFDQGIGDIFVVRVAGNVVDAVELDSVDYAADILKSPLIVVLGHQSCGAVKAVLEMENTGEPNQDIQNIVPFIEPAIVESRGKPGDPLANAVRANIKNSVNYLKSTEVIARLMKEKKLDVVGAYYTLEKGKVEILKASD